jgi:hypothetical protein
VGRLRMRLVRSVSFPQHPDQHRPKHPVLLAVDQQLGEGSLLLQDPVEVPAVGDTLQLILADLPESEATPSDEVLHSLGDEHL